MRENHYSGAFAITPHDTNKLTQTVRAIYVGGAGNITLQVPGSTTNVLFTAVPVGTILPVNAWLVRATATTATALVGLY